MRRFGGQKIDEVTCLLRENTLVYEHVPNNMAADLVGKNVGKMYHDG